MIHWGIIHNVKRPEPTIHHTIKSLHACGVEEVHVFMDAGEKGPQLNLFNGILALCAMCKTGDLVCVVDDDLVFAHRTLELVENLDLAGNKCATLWTIEQNIVHSRRDGSGWIQHPVNEHTWGGSVVMPLNMAHEVANKMGKHRAYHRYYTKPDASLFTALSESNAEVFHHLPSLADHIGLYSSTIGNDHSDGATRGFRFNNW